MIAALRNRGRGLLLYEQKIRKQTEITVFLNSWDVGYQPTSSYSLFI